MTTKCTFIGGPLDGAFHEIKTEHDQLFLIFPIARDGSKTASHYACYKMDGNKLLFDSLKTKEEFNTQVE